jgi:hypothetical protein
MDRIVKVVGRWAYSLSDVCKSDPKLLEECEHFASETERYTLDVMYETDTHDMYTGRWRTKSTHVCKACLPPKTEIMS